ncbi:MAG: GT4 family glycosyltransferase PelF [Ectobacillus sp.]
MRVAIVAEGSYPFISGGVASWIHMLISNLPDIEFEIISIMPEQFEDDKQYKYTLPRNVNYVWLYKLGKPSKRSAAITKLSPQQQEHVAGWLAFRHTNGEALQLLGNASVIGNADSFFQSRHFWEIVKDSYTAEGQAGSFLDYFWTYRSMCAPIITLLQNPFPNVDIVHAVSTGYAGLVGAYMKQQQHIPFMLTEHGIYSREREEEILQASWIPNIYKKKWIQYFHHLSRQAYESADDIITLFQRNSLYQEEIGAPKEKLKIIPNGIPYERLSKIKRPASSKTLKIGAIVRVVPIKDIKTMIYAARLLADEQVDFQLSIMGPLDEDPEYAQECTELVARLRVGQYVKFLGQVNIIEHLPHFDVLLLTSISEGQPLAVLEGMAAGIPWVATDVGSCAELLFGQEGDPFGQAGFVVPPVNPKAVAQACKWMAQNRDMAAAYGQNGKKRVESMYQLKNVINTYRALYKERGGQHGRHRL